MAYYSQYSLLDTPFNFEADQPLKTKTVEALGLDNPAIAQDGNEFQVRNPYNLPTDPDEFSQMCRIRSGARIIPFALYNYQRKLFDILQTHETVMILKDRQIGITEVLGLFLLYQMAMTDAFLGALLSINQKKASDVSDRLKLMASGLETLIWDKDSTTSKKLERAGSCEFLPSTPNAARGLPSVLALIFDECGFVEKFNEIYAAGTASQENVDPEDRLTVLNTTVPIEGELSQFWAMFDADNGNESALENIKQARQAGSNCDIPGFFYWVDEFGVAKVIISHKAHPRYGADPDYLDTVQRRKKLPRAVVEREHNLGIETTQGSLFNREAVKRQAQGQWLNKPVQGRSYMLCVDPNLGGSDNWCAQVWDCTDPVKSLVAEYAESDRSVEYSKAQTVVLINTFNPVLLAVESNNGGTIIAEDLARDKPDLRVELTKTTSASKIPNTDRVAYFVDQGLITYPADWSGIGEMHKFSLKDREATGGEKDDRVMSAAAGFAWIDQVDKAARLDKATFDEGTMTWG